MRRGPRRRDAALPYFLPRLRKAITSATTPPRASSSKVPGSGTATGGAPANASPGTRARREIVVNRRDGFIDASTEPMVRIIRPGLLLVPASITNADHERDETTQREQLERTRLGYRDTRPGPRKGRGNETKNAEAKSCLHGPPISCVDCG